MVDSLVKQWLAVVVPFSHKQRAEIDGIVDFGGLIGGRLTLGHGDGVGGIGCFDEGVVRLLAIVADVIRVEQQDRIGLLRVIALGGLRL
jgi:hypothetical protein